MSQHQSTIAPISPSLSHNNNSLGVSIVEHNQNVNQKRKRDSCINDNNYNNKPISTGSVILDRFALFRKRAQENYQKNLREKSKIQNFSRKENELVLQELHRTREAVRMRNLIKRGQKKDVIEIFKMVKEEEKNHTLKRFEKMLYNRKDRFGFSMLYHAAMNGNIQLVKFISQHISAMLEKG